MMSGIEDSALATVEKAVSDIREAKQMIEFLSRIVPEDIRLELNGQALPGHSGVKNAMRVLIVADMEEMCRQINRDCLANIEAAKRTLNIMFGAAT